MARQPIKNPRKALTRSQHRSIGTWVFGSLLFILLIAVFIFAPNILPEYKQRLLAVACSLLAGLFTFFFIGDLSLEITANKTPLGELGIKSVGGLAAVALVMWWWLSPLAPIASGARTDSPVPTPQINEMSSPTPTVSPKLTREVEKPIVPKKEFGNLLNQPTPILGQPLMSVVTIRGVVTDEANNPLPGATINVYGVRDTTITDAAGRFELPMRSERGREISLRVQKEGYKSRTQSHLVADYPVTIMLRR